jgi:hypothetical protein
VLGIVMSINPWLRLFYLFAALFAGYMLYIMGVEHSFTYEYTIWLYLL